MATTLTRPNKNKKRLKNNKALTTSYTDLTGGDEDYRMTPRPDSGYLGSSGNLRAPAPTTQEHITRKISQTSTLSIGIVDENKKDKYRQDGIIKLKELIDTENNYIKDLKEIGSFYNYMADSKKKPTPSGIAPMPEGLSDGRDQIVFANSKDLLDFHQRSVYFFYFTYRTRATINGVIFTQNRVYFFFHFITSWLLLRFAVFFDVLRLFFIKRER